MAADSESQQIISGILRPRQSSLVPVISSVSWIISLNKQVQLFSSITEDLVRFGGKINNKIRHLAGLCLK